jgi:hypothetical protein
MISIPLWFMAFISTCFSVILILYVIKGWSFEKGASSLLTSFSTVGILLEGAILHQVFWGYVFPLIPEIKVVL